MTTTPAVNIQAGSQCAREGPWPGMLSRSELRLRLPIASSLALFMAMSVVPSQAQAQAQSPSPDFAGRWRTDKPSMVLDIAPCGASWCGVEVTDKGMCGREMLRLVQGEAAADGWRGRLELAAEAQAYAVEARLGGAADNPRTLSLVGHAGSAFLPMRRVMPFRAVLVRSGEPVCRSQKPVS